MMKKVFPKDFLWGAAASAPQTEGASNIDGKAPTIWDHWFETEPERFWGEIGPADTSRFYEMYPEEIENMKKINMNSYRTSISWARLLPDGKTVNPKAKDFYNRVIDKQLAEGIEPLMNLFHFDMPLLMQEKGGWESREVVDAYQFYAETCFELFGDRVKKWFTFNEPIVVVECGYLYQFHYPCVVDMKRAVQVAFNTALASAKAIKSYHEAKIDGQIGIILNLTPSYPRSEDKEDVAAANLVDLLFNRSFLDPAVKGTYPQELIDFIQAKHLMPTYEAADLTCIAENTIDILGVNYYQPRRIQKRETPVDPNEAIMPEHFYENYEWPERVMNPHRGWEIYPKGIYDIAVNIKENYGNIPWYISENGMGVEGEEKFLKDGMIQDDYRIEFVGDHLSYLHQAIEEGANCFGYHMWTFADCWSWLNTYKNRYGYYQVDLADNAARHVKKSGLWMSQVMKENTLETKD